MNRLTDIQSGNVNLNTIRNLPGFATNLDLTHRMIDNTTLCLPLCLPRQDNGHAYNHLLFQINNHEVEVLKLTTDQINLEILDNHRKIFVFFSLNTQTEKGIHRRPTTMNNLVEIFIIHGQDLQLSLIPIKNSRD